MAIQVRKVQLPINTWMYVRTNSLIFKYFDDSMKKKNHDFNAQKWMQVHVPVKRKSMTSACFFYAF